MRKRRFIVKASRDARRRSVMASETIVYRGNRYDADTVSQYYDMDVTNYGDLGADTAQEFFDRYIELDPDFVDLFEYDIDPIESAKSVKCSARRRRSVRASSYTPDVIKTYQFADGYADVYDLDNGDAVIDFIGDDGNRVAQISVEYEHGDSKHWIGIDNDLKGNEGVSIEDVLTTPFAWENGMGGSPFDSDYWTDF